MPQAFGMPGVAVWLPADTNVPCISLLPSTHPTTWRVMERLVPLLPPPTIVRRELAKRGPSGQDQMIRGLTGRKQK